MIRTVGIATLRRTFLTACVAFSILSCQGPTAPEKPASIVPTIATAAIDDARLRDGAILYVTMRPVDWEYVLPSNQYLEAEIATSSGDSELLLIRRQVCGRSMAEAYYCRTFSVSMLAGADVRDLAADLATVGARPSLTSATGSFGSFYVFGDLSRAMRRAALLPNVEFVDYVNIFTSGGPEPPFTAWLAGALPFSHSATQVRDGVLQAIPGDTVRIKYSQPAGDLLEFEAVVP